MQHIAALALSAVVASSPCIHLFDAPRTLGPVLPDLAANADVIVAVADFDGDGKADLLTQTSIAYGFSRPVPLPVPILTPVRITDVNRDGRPDTVTVRQNDFLVLVNNGDTTFTIKTTAHASFVSSWAFGDFNRDGLLDVFVPGMPAYLAGGDGTFHPENGLAIGAAARWIAADLDGDGLPDLLGNQPVGCALLFAHRTAHDFDAPQCWPAQYGAPLLVADFDRDGRDDVIFPGLLVFGNGDAPPSRTAPAPVSDAGAQIVDFNNDGAPDLFVDGAAYLNDGHGGFRQTSDIPIAYGTAIAADADGDGIADIVMADRGEPVIVHGNGDGTFRVPRIALSLAAGRNAVAGDFDGDGDDDIALPGFMAWNDGGVFHLEPLAASKPFAAADIDGDGVADVITLESSGVRALHLHRGGAAVEVGQANVTWIISAAVGDFSGTHHPELAVLTGHDVQVFEFRSGAAPRFTATPQGPGLPRSIVAADINGDGADDIVVAGGTVISPPVEYSEYWDDSLDGYLSTYLSTRGSFEAERQLRYRDPTGGAALDSLAAGDFDGDGRTDIAAATVPAAQLFNRREPALVVFRGDGSGAFAVAQEAPLPRDSAFALIAADLDGDGRTDIAVNGAARVFLGTPHGLAEQRHYFAPYEPSRLFPTFVPLVVHPQRNALPWIVVPAAGSADAFVYKPLCAATRSRGVRH
jgi:hypothetical protein